MADSIPATTEGKLSAPATGSVRIGAIPTLASSPPVNTVLAGKRLRPEETAIETSAKRPRSQGGPAASPSNAAGPTHVTAVSGTPLGKDKTAKSAPVNAVSSSDALKAEGSNSKVAPGAPATSGAADDKIAVKGGVKAEKREGIAKKSPSKANMSATNSPGEQKSRASPRAPAELPEDEKPLDLFAMRQFEYDQVSTFGPSQQKRYEQYRRSDLKKEKVKKVCAALNPSLGKVSEQFIIALKGLAKVFVGDVVETALEVKTKLGDTGALQPKHLREAYRQLRRDGIIPF